MIYKKYRVVLSRDVLVTCPEGSGVVQTDTMDAVLLVEDIHASCGSYPKERKVIDFEGKGDAYYSPGPWKLVKIDVEIHDPSQDAEYLAWVRKEMAEGLPSDACKAVMPDRIARTEQVQPKLECFGWYNARAIACAGLCLDARECGKHMFPPKEQKPAARRDDDPPVEASLQYWDDVLSSYLGKPLPPGRFVLREYRSSGQRLWDRELRGWQACGRDEVGKWLWVAANMRFGGVIEKWLNENVHCTCPTKCDCANPDGEGVASVSNMCPVHNDNPMMDPACPVHGNPDEEDVG